MNNLELYPRQHHGLYFFVQFSKKLANERLLFAEFKVRVVIDGRTGALGYPAQTHLWQWRDCHGAR